MALSHNRLSPGIEFYEYDRSNYNTKRDYSLVDTTTLICGFANRGTDSVVKWINSRADLENEYGAPTNEVEKYFFNGINEILNRGGIALAAKLPYINEYYDKYSYVDYEIIFKTTDEPFTFQEECSNTIYEQIQSADQTLTSFFKIIPVGNESISAQIDYPRDFKTALSTIAKAIHQKSPKIIDSVDIYDDLMEFMQKVDAYEVINAHQDYNATYKACKQTVYDFITWINQNWKYGNGSGYITIDEFDRLKTSSMQLKKNRIRFVDVSRRRYGTAKIQQRVVKSQNQMTVNDVQCLGYMPVITTAVNSMYFHDIIDSVNSVDDGTLDKKSVECDFYSPVKDFRSVRSRGAYDFTDMYSIPFTSGSKYQDSVSRRAAMTFTPPVYTSDKRLQRDNLKKIGVVVFEVTVDEADNSKLQFTPVESFMGSLDRSEKDPITHGSVFIDDIVNNNSKYINMFSNLQKLGKAYKLAQTAVIEDQMACTLGFYEDEENEKTIDHVESIVKPLIKIFDKLQDMTHVNLDIVVDAGISNIAQFASLFKTCESDGCVKFNSDMYPYGLDDNIWKFDKDQLGIWYSIVQKYDNFCKNMRKDCIFLADAPRTLVLEGDQKIVRLEKVENTIASSIVPNIRHIPNVNSSYSAGYCNWFKQNDAYSNDPFWIPPSIKAAGVMTYTDAYYKPWDAPAGLNRGVLRDVYDSSFDPRNDEAGRIYQQAWNYATNFPLEGIVVEGQKTFQLQQTSLDRINVRRLMLYIEKNVVKLGRRFLYEQNTEQLRQKYVDLVDVLLKDVQQRDGIREYAIKCDSDINTDETIDRHEMHMIIGIKPVKTIEWIRLNFIVTNQTANVTEEVLRTV